MNNKQFYDFLLQLLGENALMTSIAEMEDFLENYKISSDPDAVLKAERLKSDLVGQRARVRENENAANNQTEDRKTLLIERNNLNQALKDQYRTILAWEEINYTEYGRSLIRLGKYRLTRGLLIKAFFWVFFLAILSGVGSIAYMIYKESQKPWPPKQIDANKYTIIFDEATIIYQNLNMPQNVKNYRICFKAKGGTQPAQKLIDQRLGSFSLQGAPTMAIPLRQATLKDVDGEKGCSIQLGFDTDIANACTGDAALSFPFEIGKEQFDYANKSGGAVMPLQRNLSHFMIDLKYRIIKQPQ